MRVKGYFVGVYESPHKGTSSLTWQIRKKYSKQFKELAGKIADIDRHYALVPRPDLFLKINYCWKLNLMLDMDGRKIF